MTRLKGIIYTLCVWIIPSPIIKFGKKNTKTSQKPGAHSSISLSIGSSSLPVEVWNFLGQGSVSKSPRRKSSCRTWRFQEGCKLVEPLGFRTEDWRLIFGNKNIAGWVDATKYYKMLWLILSQLLRTYFVPNFFGWSVWCETVTRTIPRKKDSRWNTYLTSNDPSRKSLWRPLSMPTTPGRLLPISTQKSVD